MTKLQDFQAAEQVSRYAANRLLLTWLSDDKLRAELYEELRRGSGALDFQSRADAKLHSWLDVEPEFHQDVVLLARRADIEAALRGDGYGNAPYQMLGSGTFVLGLDDKGKAAAQLDVVKNCFQGITPTHIRTLAHLAFLAAAALPLKQRNFDLADLAEQAAARFVGFLFGFEQGDQLLIEQSMRSAYRALDYVILGRHFVSEPGKVDEASRAMGALLIRAAQLIDVYQARIGRAETQLYERMELEREELEEFMDRKGEKPLADFVPILQRMGRIQDSRERKFSGSELAVVVVGLIAGTIGNIQASVCIAVNELFDPRHKSGFLEEVRELARKSVLNDRDYEEPVPQLEAWIWEALRLNPPAAFLPRVTTRNIRLEKGGEVPAGKVVILAMGSATQQEGGTKFRYEPPQNPDELIFGEGGGHPCVGQFLAMPLVARIVRQVMALPGLEQTLDPETGDLRRLEKTWGFYCDRYPLEYNRFDLLTQSPLIVVMRVKTPVAVHAEALKQIIKYGAPRIEKKLRESAHVHFASFLFVENDSKLILYTVYDRDFDAYIEYFALKIGPLFDRIFEHIEDAPPMPVKKFPKEFVDTIRRYNARPAADYFFSAYPKADVSKITHHYPPEDR